MPTDAFYIRLKNGDQLVSRMTRANNMITMDHPMEIHVSTDQTGRPSVGLFEWITQPFVNTQLFELPNAEVLISLPASKELSEYYQETLDKMFAYRKREQDMKTDQEMNQSSDDMNQSKSSKRYLH